MIDIDSPDDIRAQDITADALAGTHIGEVIQFDWTFPHGTNATVRGQLRQVYHAAGRVSLSLVSPDPDADPPGDLDEFDIDPSTDILLEP